MTAEAPARVVLADGEMATVRRLHPADATAVLTLHTTLTERDRYLRFFGPVPSTLDKVATAIAAESGATHAAVGCFLRGALVGVAQYEVLAEPATAEIALVVDGEVRTHGIATLMLEHLVWIARGQGVRKFVAEVLAENSRVIRVFADLGLPFEASRGGPEREVTLLLDPDEAYFDAVARRELTADAASLGHLFRPESVVVIGAGRRPGSVGHAVLANILGGGFPGDVHVVNPHAAEILGRPCVRSVAELPEAVELAVVCLPAEACAGAVDECGRRGVRAVVLISSGLTGTDAGERVAEAVRRHGMRLVGPNCLGIATTEPGHVLNATFLRDAPRAGDIGIVTQSGGVGIALTEALNHLGLGVSTMVSTGDKYDVSGNDMLLWWTQDERTRLAVLYLESFGNPRKFGRFARTLARTKPVLAVRTGSGEVAQAAAASHTAAAATPAVTRDALYEQAGVIAVDTVAELVDVLAALSWQPLPRGPRVAIYSNAGGSGVLAADACERAGLTIASLSPETTGSLRELLSDQASVRNPVDTTAAITPELFGEGLRIVLGDEGVDTVIAITVPTAVGDPGAALRALAVMDGKPVLAVRPGQEARVRPLGATACYDDPASAAAVLGRLAPYAAWRAQPIGEASPFPGIDRAALASVIRARLDQGGGWLAPTETAELLRLAGIPMVESHYATDEDAAVLAFERLGGPVVLKADAEGLLHKSSGGGVALGVTDAGGVREVLRGMRERFGPALRGVVVQPMAGPGRELIVGVRSDEVFGPLVVFGFGGVDTDLVADHSARLAPLTTADAERLMDDLRLSAGLWAADTGAGRAAMREVLLRAGRLAELVPEIAELDLNPVRLTATGCLALDARVRVERREPADPFLRRLREV